MSQEGVINLVVIVFLGKKECRDSDCTGTDQWHLDRLKWISVSKENGQQRQHNGKHRLDQEHGCCCTDVVYDSSSLIYNVGHGCKVWIQKHHLQCSLRHRCPVPLQYCNRLLWGGRTSLTPSPVIATVWPCFWRACTISFFCCGVTRPKTLYFATASSNCSSVFQCCRIYVVLGILEPCTFRDCGNCDRIITGDHLEVNLLAVKEL